MDANTAPVKQKKGNRASPNRVQTAQNAFSTAPTNLEALPSFPLELRGQPPFEKNPAVIKLSPRFQEQIVNNIINHINERYDEAEAVKTGEIRERYRKEINTELDRLQTELVSKQSEHDEWETKINEFLPKAFELIYAVKRIENSMQTPGMTVEQFKQALQEQKQAYDPQGIVTPAFLGDVNDVTQWAKNRISNNTYDGRAAIEFAASKRRPVAPAYQEPPAFQASSQANVGNEVDTCMGIFTLSTDGARHIKCAQCRVANDVFCARHTSRIA